MNFIIVGTIVSLISVFLMSAENILVTYLGMLSLVIGLYSIKKGRGKMTQLK